MQAKSGSIAEIVTKTKETAEKVAQQQAEIKKNVKASKVNIKELAPSAGKWSVDPKIDMDTLTTKQTAAVSYLKAVSEVSGINITLMSGVDVTGAFSVENGHYDGVTNTLYVSVNAGMQSITDITGSAILKTASHEITHYIAASGTQTYSLLEDYVLSRFTEQFGEKSVDNRIEDIQEQYKDQVGKELTREQAREEMVAAACEMMLKNSEVFEKLARQNLTLAQRIKAGLDGFIKKLSANRKAAFENLDATSPEARAIAASETSLKETQKLWDNALKGAIKENEGGRASKDTMLELRDKRDTEYAKLAKDPEKNEKRLSQLVEQAAKAAGYDSPLLYHGTQSFGFTAFDLAKTDDGRSIFLTSNPDIASTYSGISGSRRISEAADIDVNGMSVREVAQMLNRFPPESGIDYAYSYVPGKAEIAEQVDSGIKELRKLTESLRERFANDSPEMYKLNHLRNVLDIGKTDSLSATLWTMLNKTDIFNGHTDFVNNLEQNIRLLKKAPESGGFVVEKSLDGYSIEVFTESAARKELSANLRRGNYALYAKLGNSLTVEGDGENWNALDFRAPDSKYEIQEDDGRYKIINKSTRSAEWANGKMSWNSKEEAQRIIDGFSDKNNWAKRLSNTRQIAEYAKEQGYDSVLFRNIRDNGGQNASTDFDTTADVYVIFNPNNVKSADTVTRDGNGNVIPLSQRFNARENDIRFELRDEGRYNAEYEKPITSEDIEPLRSIGRKNIKDFTSEDIAKTQKWAYKFYRELGTKSPFFRASFGEWRAYDTTNYTIVEASGNKYAGAGRATNADMNRLVSWGDVLNKETQIHADRSKVSTIALGDIGKIVENAVLLDTVVSEASSKSKMPNTAFMHSLYSIYENNGAYYLLKLYVEEALPNRGGEPFTRAYELKNIEKIANLPNGVLSVSEGLTDGRSAIANNTVAALYNFVKRFDKDFSAGTAVNPILLNKDGTPKVFYHGAKKNGGFTEFRPWQYFTAQKNYAQRYAERGNDNSLYAVYLRADKAFDTRDAEAKQIFENIRQEYGLGELQDTGLPDWTDGYDISDYLDEHPELGYDAIILDEGGDLVDGKPVSRGESIVIKDSSQIKSATDNIGTFDKGNRNILYQLREVTPVEPSSEKWARSLTTAEAKQRFPDLWDVSAEESDTRNPTQVKITESSYRKIYDILKQEGFDGTILDASSGLGHGTRVGIEDYGFKVDDIEPYPSKDYSPKYTDYSKLDKTYDAIISNAVLNVLPQDQRDALVVKMGQMLNPGGQMFINVRGDDVLNASSKEIINRDNLEVYITKSGSYQKGFTRNELVAYLQDALGDGYTVRADNRFGKVSAVVTKATNTDVRFELRDNQGRELTQAQAEKFKDSQVRDKDGRLKTVYHGSSAVFNVFSADFMSQHGSSEGQGFYFTDYKDMAEGYQKKGGQLLEGYLNITNPLSDSEVTLSAPEVKRLLKALDPTGDDVILNYDSQGGMGYPSKAWYNRALADTVNMIMSTSESDSEILAEIANAGAGSGNVMDTVRKVLGYDGYIVEGKYGNANVYVAFGSDQFKSFDNKTPTSSPDIHLELRSDENQFNPRKELSNLFMEIAQNEQEKKSLRSYQAAIHELNNTEIEISKLQQEMQGTDKLKSPQKYYELQNKLRQAEAKLNRYDGRLVQLEATKPMKDLIARREQRLKEQFARSSTTRAKYRNNIKKNIRSLDKKLRTNSGQKHVLLELQPVVAQLLNVFTENTSVFKKEQLARLREIYAKFNPEADSKISSTEKEVTRWKSTAEYSSAYSEMIYDLIEEVRPLVQGKRLIDLDTELLAAVNDIVSNIKQKSAVSGSLPRRRFSVADQSEHFTAKPPLKK